ncbi:hypothetical protein IAU60_005114 [Kwoniella sp. DSM 27419]
MSQGSEPPQGEQDQPIAGPSRLTPPPSTPRSRAASPSPFDVALAAGNVVAKAGADSAMQQDLSIDADVDDLLCGLGADDLDDFGDIDDEDIVGDKSFELAHPREQQDLYGEGPPESFSPGMSDDIPPGIPTIGFATGSGKKLAPPTKAALAKARKLWTEDEAESQAVDGLKPDLGDERAKKPRLSDPDEYLDQPVHDGLTQDVPLTLGFTTGNGAKVPPPSSSALSKAAKLMGEVDKEVEGGKVMGIDTQPEAGPSRGPSGFTFASGKPAPPPDPATLARVKHLLDDDNEAVATGVPSTPARPAFQPPTSSAPSSQPPSSSAIQPLHSRNPEPPSTTSLAKGRGLFDDNENDFGADFTPADSPSMSGFKLGTGKAAPVPSSSSKAKVMHLFDDIDTNLITPAKQRAQPFARPSSPAMTPATRYQPPQSSQAFTPLRTSSAAATSTLSAKRPLDIKTPSSGARRIGLGGGTPSQRNKRGFNSPFKPPLQPKMSTPTIQSSEVVHYRPVFDLTPPPARETYKAAYLHPQYYSMAELRELDIPDELWEINLGTASDYRFFRSHQAFLGHEQALAELQEAKCGYATAQWVENHWGQILWKLAGQVLAKPDLFPAKWCWTEVINQLKYRYEREYGKAERSIIKRIQEHDSSPSLPMVLYVSSIHRAEVDGKQTCSLELSDGWYRIRAQIDENLRRAVIKGKIVVGRKLAIAGAKLESGSDGTEVLQAFDVSHLVITGNSTSLARWYTRLGAQSHPFIAALGSISVDGGVVHLMEIVIDKIFPIAFTNTGRDVREPPWNEAEEQTRQDAWMDRYTAERSRLEDQMRRRLERLEDLAYVLAQTAEESEPTSSEPPDSLESDFESLRQARDASSRLRGMSSHQIVHLARYAAMHVGYELTEGRAEIEAEMTTLCPKRDVRDFRMVRFSDARSGVREPFRAGMLNVWDVRALGPGALQEGKRCLVSNLAPARSGDWSLRRDRADKAEVYLHTRRDTRWQPLS